MLKIKTKDDKYLEIEIEKEILMKIDYLKIYLFELFIFIHVYPF